MAGKFSIGTIFKGIDQLTAPLSKMQAKLGAFGKTASSALKGANKIADKGMAGIAKFSDAIGIAGVASVAGLGVVLKDTIDEGANFERTMVFAAAQFPGMIKQGTKEFEALQAAARKVGDETEFSSQDAAEGLTLLATAGLSAEAAIAALPKVVNFATASKVEFARASDIANDAMGAFSLTSEDAAKNAANMSRVMDVFTRAAADSTTNVEELFEAVKMGGPIAKTAGMSLEQFVGYTEALAKTGIKGGEAGTALRNMFLELGAPSTAAVKGMAALGVRLAKTKTGAIDLGTTIERFSKATSKMTRAQKIAALGNVLGARTIGPFIALMDAGKAQIDEYQKSLEGAAGTTDGMAKLLSADMLGALRNFSSLIDGVKLDVFTAIRPILSDLVKSTSDWVTQNRELIKTNAAEWLGKLRDNLPQIWGWTVLIVKALAGLAVLGVLVKTISTIVTVVGWLSTAWSVLSAAAAVVVPMIAAVSWPIVLIGVAIAAVVALIWAFWPEIKAFFSGIADWATATWERFWAATVSVFNRFKAFVVGVLEFVVGANILIWTPVVKFFAGIWDGVVAAFARAWGWIVTQATAVYGLFLQVWTPIADFFQGIWARVTAGFASAWGWVLTQAAAFYTQFLQVWTPITQFFEGLWQSIVDKFDAIVGPIIEGISSFVAKVRAVGHAALGGEEKVPERPDQPAPQVVSPQARAASEAAEANANASVDGTITVAPAPGAKATVRNKPRTVPLKVQPSGAF